MDQNEKMVKIYTCIGRSDNQEEIIKLVMKEGLKSYAEIHKNDLTVNFPP